MPAPPIPIVSAITSSQAGTRFMATSSRLPRQRVNRRGRRSITADILTLRARLPELRIIHHPPASQGSPTTWRRRASALQHHPDKTTIPPCIPPHETQILPTPPTTSHGPGTTARAHPTATTRPQAPRRRQASPTGSAVRRRGRPHGATPTGARNSSTKPSAASESPSPPSPAPSRPISTSIPNRTRPTSSTNHSTSATGR